MFRPHCKSAAEAEVRQASDPKASVEQANRADERGQHRRQGWRMNRPSNKNSVANRRDDPVSEIQRAVSQNRRRRRASSKDLRVSGSARRHPWEQVGTGNPEEVHRLDLVSRSRLVPGRDMRMRRAPNEKECRALTASHRNSNNSEAARLPQRIAVRDVGSRKVDVKDNPDKRRRQGSNNLGALTPAAPER